MAQEEPIKILLTGATGFIGGTVLTTLLQSPTPALQNPQNYTVILRNSAQQSHFHQQGIHTTLITDLNTDTSTLQAAASEADIVINCATGFATAAARALILGLGQRKRKYPQRPNFIVHISGTTNLTDRPISGTFIEPRYVSNGAFRDDEDITAYLRERERLEPYPQRTTDLTVIDHGLEEDVDTYIIMPGLVWGQGTGAFITHSISVPSLVHAAQQQGQMAVLGDGRAIMDHVHVQDLSQLFERVASTRLSDAHRLPKGKEGLYFCSTGRISWADLTHALAQAGREAGVWTTDAVRSVGIDDAAALWTGNVVAPRWIELGYALNARTEGVKARELWRPRFASRDAFVEGLRAEVGLGGERA